LASVALRRIVQIEVTLTILPTPAAEAIRDDPENSRH
jgi:hypothetical protein